MTRRWPISILALAIQLDVRLRAVSRRTQQLAIALTFLIMACLWAPYVPRAFVDYARLPLLNHISQTDTYGPDTISDMYESRVILHDLRDMYTKKGVEQTPFEFATWSKDASAPYPPAVLLVDAALYQLGEWLGVGFYGMILALACLFLGLSAWYFLDTRWYLFPALYLTSLYFGYRFVYVQDDTYLVMLVVIMLALFAARRRSEITHALMALAIVMKLSPLYYVKHIVSMKRSSAVLFSAVLAAGLIAPYFLWPNYLYIFRYQDATKATGGHVQTAVAIAIAGVVTALLSYVDVRGDFDLEDKVGWALVPCAMFLGYKLNVPRHLAIVLLVPDKRALRNLALAGGMFINTLIPSIIGFDRVLPIATIFLIAGLVYYVHRIGWGIVRNDVCHPRRTARLLISAA